MATKEMKRAWKGYRKASKKKNRSRRECFYAGHEAGEIEQMAKQLNDVESLRTLECVGTSPAESKSVDSKKEMGQVTVSPGKTGK